MVQAKNDIFRRKDNPEPGLPTLPRQSGNPRSNRVQHRVNPDSVAANNETRLSILSVPFCGNDVCGCFGVSPVTHDECSRQLLLLFQGVDRHS